MVKAPAPVLALPPEETVLLLAHRTIPADKLRTLALELLTLGYSVPLGCLKSYGVTVVNSRTTVH